MNNQEKAIEIIGKSNYSKPLAQFDVLIIAQILLSVFKIIKEDCNLNFKDITNLSTFKKILLRLICRRASRQVNKKELSKESYEILSNYATVIKEDEFYELCSRSYD